MFSFVSGYSSWACDHFLSQCWDLNLAQSGVGPAYADTGIHMCVSPIAFRWLCFPWDSILNVKLHQK